MPEVASYAPGIEKVFAARSTILSLLWSQIIIFISLKPAASSSLRSCLLYTSVIMVVLVPRFKRVQRQIDSINRITRENLTGIKVVHAFNAEQYQCDKFKTANDNLTKTQLFNQRTLAVLMPVMTLAMNGLALAIYWIGAALINNIPSINMAERLTLFSDVVVFSTYATSVSYTHLKRGI